MSLYELLYIVLFLKPPVLISSTYNDIRRRKNWEIACIVKFFKFCIAYGIYQIYQTWLGSCVHWSQFGFFNSSSQLSYHTTWFTDKSDVLSMAHTTLPAPRLFMRWLIIITSKWWRIVWGSGWNGVSLTGGRFQIHTLSIKFISLT